MPRIHGVLERVAHYRMIQTRCAPGTDGVLWPPADVWPPPAVQIIPDTSNEVLYIINRIEFAGEGGLVSLVYNDRVMLSSHVWNNMGSVVTLDYPIHVQTDGRLVCRNTEYESTVRIFVTGHERRPVY